MWQIRRFQIERKRPIRQWRHRATLERTIAINGRLKRRDLFPTHAEIPFGEIISDRPSPPRTPPSNLSPEAALPDTAKPLQLGFVMCLSGPFGTKTKLKTFPLYYIICGEWALTATEVTLFKPQALWGLKTGELFSFTYLRAELVIARDVRPGRAFKWKRYYAFGKSILYDECAYDVGSGLESCTLVIRVRGQITIFVTETYELTPVCKIQSKLINSTQVTQVKNLLVNSLQTQANALDLSYVILCCECYRRRDHPPVSVRTTIQVAVKTDLRPYTRPSFQLLRARPGHAANGAETWKLLPSSFKFRCGTYVLGYLTQGETGGHERRLF
ncbi:hypothetical protein EVAR_26844_1 [Eumeta japonica]|uniref:Uncharacterized protein n=1 Tax=Eumeta variegata TaxID=151549 RepID=A0A4C1VY36_EUMVA|nr:hypothetical protein EVAR_26844_1 [Eumeta japonica]